MLLTYKELAAAVTKKVENPAEWLWTLRRLVEMAGGDVTRFVPIDISTLELACWKTMDLISRHRDLNVAFQRVIVEWSVS